MTETDVKDYVANLFEEIGCEVMRNYSFRPAGLDRGDPGYMPDLLFMRDGYSFWAEIETGFGGLEFEYIMSKEEHEAMKQFDQDGCPMFLVIIFPDRSRVYTWRWSELESWQDYVVATVAAAQAQTWGANN